MRSFKLSLAITSCVVTLMPGGVFADNLHPMVPSPNANPGAATAAPGQTGSNVLSSCGATDFFSIGAGAKMNGGTGSPFNPDATKKYAGNPGNPATNPKAVSQYDNACAQASMHSPP
jgi:hypothetical protein